MNEIIAYFKEIDPVLAAFLATLFTWGVTALGASLVFFFKGMNRAGSWLRPVSGAYWLQVLR